MIDQFCCPIIGCPHYPDGPGGKKFTSLTNLIRHLKGDDHKNSKHLLNHDLCNIINLFRCTHHKCINSDSSFFTSKRAYDEHSQTVHPKFCQSTQDTPTNIQQKYADIFFYQPGHEDLTNNWNNAITFIDNNYKCTQPHFRSTWRRFLKGNNKIRFYNTIADIISAILQAHTTNNSSPYWWLLFHFEMLILAPTPQQNRQNLSTKQVIHQRLRRFQTGDIETLLEDTTFNNNWNKTSPRPNTHTGNKAAQIAADNDNYRTATTRACTFNKIATIDDSNISIVKNLYPKPVKEITTPPNYTPNIHPLFLQGNICDTIRTASKNKGTGLRADSIDTFIHLIKINDEHINRNLEELFQLIYQGTIPTEAHHFFTDTYLFCLH